MNLSTVALNVEGAEDSGRHWQAEPRLSPRKRRAFAPGWGRAERAAMSDSDWASRETSEERPCSYSMLVSRTVPPAPPQRPGDRRIRTKSAEGATLSEAEAGTRATLTIQ
jgi:hypothetical protein